MVRPFDWRDIALLHRMRKQGVPLDPQIAFTRGINTFQIALMEVLAPGHNGCTLVVPRNDKEPVPVMGHLIHRVGQARAQLGFVGPEDAIDSSLGLQLLDALSHDAGRRGAMHLIAQVDENCAAFESLRHAGFAIYARQRVWLLHPEMQMPDAPAQSAWQPARDKDQAALHFLYLNLVPALVQQVERAPQHAHHDLIHYQEGECRAYLDVEAGSLGLWVQPYLHPAVEDIDARLSSALHSFQSSPGRPIYMAVRSYQGWIGQALQRLGLEAVAEQAVMVKRLTASLKRPVSASLPAVEGTHPEPTTPFATLQQGPSQPKSSGTKSQSAGP